MARQGTVSRRRRGPGLWAKPDSVG